MRKFFAATPSTALACYDCYCFETGQVVCIDLTCVSLQDMFTCVKTEDAYPHLKQMYKTLAGDRQVCCTTRQSVM